MDHAKTPPTDAAAALFDELRKACAQAPGYRKAYWRLNRCFQRFLNERTDFAGVRFNGTFAKTDYLLKEHRAPRPLQQKVNDARARLRRLRELKDDELEEHFAHDMKAVCQFVALVCQTPVPADLQATFPKDRTRQRGRLKAEYLRIIVNRWDDTCLYANADAPDSDEVTVFYGGKSPLAVYADWDWSYLRDIIRAGCQLNIVRPREHDGVLYPELFIWEPDFLVDISAIAACFESYAVSPTIHLLNKLKPAVSTQPMVLGNLAGQFLDEELYSQPGESAYAESVKKFFKGNAISLLTTELADDFHTQAQKQKSIIRETLRSKLPEVLHAENISFDAQEVMVEPSFFSEMLGLQGRMDFLQLDKEVLIEQKSGKAGFPESDPPRQQEKHYVQLLLYMLLIRYNYRQKYEENKRNLFAFLLYSRYTNGLLPLGFAPGLMFEAVKIRNEMAAREYGYSHDGLDILRNLTAESLNQNKAHGPLWERYQKPEIETLLKPIREATELERAYYLRFLKFLQTEHLMAKVGSQTRENAGFADKWLSSLEDKQLAGNIYCGMDLLSPEQTETVNVEQVVLGFTEEPDHEISNFRAGDIVILYPYTDGEEPDARKTMVFRATIAKITADKLWLSLRAKQVNANVFWHEGKRKWAIEHDFFESSFASLYRAMHAFLSAPKERRDLLLLQRTPRVDKGKTLKGDYGTFNELALRAKQAQELFLIIGPPGTGKTSYGLLNTLKEELVSAGDGSVLLLSYTNRAVDEICAKLMASGIDFIRIGGRFACDDSCRPYLLEGKIDGCTKIGQLKAMITQARVFVGTTTAFNANISLFKLKQFSLAIIDEASQILEPHLTGLLGATADDGSCAIRKMVLIGDHKQLPAVVQQNEEEAAVSEPALNDIHLTNCRLSLFERLLRQYRDHPDVTYMLTRQGRMHHEIAAFPNQAFYQGKLEEVPLPHQHRTLPTAESGDMLTDMLTTRRIAFVDIPETPQRASDKVNSNEARAIAATAVRIYELNKDTFSPQCTLGIIVPYRNQISEIRNCIGHYHIKDLDRITIDTVERFQGSQRDYIIYGFTVQERYQLKFLTNNVFEEDGCIIDRKLNVAMTRAREHLLLFGNTRLLAGNTTFNSLMEFAKSKHSFFQLPTPNS